MNVEEFAALDAQMEELEDLLKDADAFSQIPMSDEHRQYVDSIMRKAEASAELLRIGLAATEKGDESRDVESSGADRDTDTTTGGIMSSETRHAICVYAGREYTEGSIVCQADGYLKECRNGVWKNFFPARKCPRGVSASELVKGERILDETSD